ncbi:hypothetical protein MNBD_PLANCTO02-1551 [hydrothermal vent metagenome]|uniref:TRASH domain-containing protein n=1 Tax=hydrothermal vent metagenome TaxID=652676 RepID=A0A3B1DIC3_9ZZZZ
MRRFLISKSDCYRNVSLLVLLFLLLFCLQQTNPVLHAEGKEKSLSRQTRFEQEKLSTLNGVVGEWRGVGMLRRGSSKGAWREKAVWVWNFEKKKPRLVYNVSQGKQIKSASIQYDSNKKNYLMIVKLPDESTRKYRGNWNKKELVLTSKPQKDGYVYRLSIRPLNEKRTILLQERRKNTQTFFSRIASVGYTRKGTSLAVEGVGEPVCIVTGGKGTMQVTHEGKEYYICCSGCKDAFENDPEGIIAEYKKKIKVSK